MSRALDDLSSLDSPLVVYVGEALPVAAGLPTRAALASSLLDAAADYLPPPQLAELSGLIDGGELTSAFTELERTLTPAGFGRLVEAALDDDAADVPPLGHAIAKLGKRIRGVVTPNLDHLLERAFEGRLIAHARPTADLPGRTGWLLKLHGTLRDRTTWALTETQQARVLHRDPLHREVFRSLFLAHPVLYVGTRLDDPGLTELLEQIQVLAQGQPPRHWALVDPEEATPIRRRKLAAAGVELVTGDEASRLAILEALAKGAPAPKPKSTPAPAPTPQLAQVRGQPEVSEPDSNDRLAILFVAANPTGTDPLRLDRELRLIREAIERSRGRDHLRLDIRTAATVHDLRRALLDTRYDVVHVCGHGEKEGLVLEDDRGESVQVPAKAVARLLSRYAPPTGGLRCVVLNACWTLDTGEATSMGVPFTIAMDGPISDAGALEFSRGFYDALGAGREFPDAFEEGRSCVDLAAPDAQFVSILLRG